VDLLGGFQLNASNLDQLQNEIVKPEFVNNLEAGYEWNRPDFRITLNVFYMNFTNEIAPIGAFVPEGFLQLRKNILSSYRTGLELDFSWKPIHNLEFSGSSTYMRSRIREYRPEGFSQAFEQVEQALNPEWQGNGRLLYRPLKWLELETSVNYAGESFLEPTNQPGLILPAYWVLNGRIGLRFTEKWSLDVLTNNIFDRLYYTYGAPVDPDFDGNNEPGYFVQPPRHFYGMLKMMF
jgi:outer membrane receptor protein involved in Fe transport